MSPGHPLIVVCDHPSLHRGFATVGRHVARWLHESAQWRVHVIGRYPRAAAAWDEPYDVLDEGDEREGDGRWRMTHMLQRLVAEARDSTTVVPLLSIGTPGDQAFVLDRLLEAGIRSRVRLVAYMPVNAAPVSPAMAAMLAGLDVVVPYTEHARRALILARDAAGPAVASPIPHGVDVSAFAPPSPALRRQVREEVFGLADDDLLVGYFGRNSGHKHPDGALAVFAVFARGAYVTCRACGGVTVSDIDPVDGSVTRVTGCDRCGGDRLDAGVVRDRARLYLHTELLDPGTRQLSGGWDLQRLARHYGIEGQVVFNGDLKVGEGVPTGELARRMGACDIHLLPYESGGWELTVLETAACGVPNVVTETAAPPEYAGPFSELVPTRLRLLDGAGLRGFIDRGGAVQALVRLADDPGYRRSLAEQGPRTAARYTWEHIGPRWHQLLTAVVEGGR